jgi:hypothetical protein
MLRKIAFIIATTTIAVPVGTAIASSTAGAATRPAAVVAHDRQEKSEPASKDRSRENSSTDKSKDSHDSKDTSKDSTDSPSPERTPSTDHSIG